MKQKSKSNIGGENNNNHNDNNIYKSNMLRSHFTHITFKRDILKHFYTDTQIHRDTYRRIDDHSETYIHI